MRKVLISILILINFLFANDIHMMLKKECQYRVYGNGESIEIFKGYLYGLAEGIEYTTPSKDRTSFATQDLNVVVDVACKEAFNNNGSHPFLVKFKWGLSVTLDKNYTEYSTIK